MTRFKIVPIFIFCTLKSFAGIGLGDWSSKTPYGNKIENNGGQYILLENGQVIMGLDKWYFYKNQIIGKLHNAGHVTSYFIVDEKNFKIITVKNEMEWKNIIENRRLQPLLWTRWYNTDWKDLLSAIVFLSIVFFYISIPFVIILFWISFRAIKYERLNFRKPFTIISMSIFGLLLIEFLLEQFPQSL